PRRREMDGVERAGHGRPVRLHESRATAPERAIWPGKPVAELTPVLRTSYLEDADGGTHPNPPAVQLLDPPDIPAHRHRPPCTRHAADTGRGPQCRLRLALRRLRNSGGG